MLALNFLFRYSHLLLADHAQDCILSDFSLLVSIFAVTLTVAILVAILIVKVDSFVRVVVKAVDKALVHFVQMTL